MPKILIVEDDTTLTSEISRVLAARGFLVDVANSGAEAEFYLKAADYDLLILDLKLPDTNGFDIARDIRTTALGNIPIMFLTAKQSIEDKETGFAIGGDDYLTKPFEVRELVARVQALLNRPAQLKRRLLKARNITLDLDKHEVYRDGDKIELFPKEFAVLEFLMSHPNQIFSPDTLLRRLWSTDAESSLETLRVTVMRIRQKLAVDDGKPLIVTLRNIGYRLEP